MTQVLGPNGDDVVKRDTQSGQLVFRSIGDTGSTRGPENQSLVADKMTADFEEEVSDNIPQFFFHLGDVIYNFEERENIITTNFTSPTAIILRRSWRWPATMTDGGARQYDREPCGLHRQLLRRAFRGAAGGGGLSRTVQIQPGVFFTFEAPMLRILALYSNVLEDPGSLPPTRLAICSSNI